MLNKPKFGWFELTGCAGCGLALVHMEDDLLDILSLVDLQEFQMVTSVQNAGDDLEVAFVEGSICTEHNLEELKEVREMADVLVAIGTCATWGGVQGLGNDMSRKELFESVYDLDADTERPDFFKSLKPAPLSEYVEVDYELTGCPPNKDQMKQLIIDLVKGVDPLQEDRPVCRECKLNGYECVLEEYGLPCLGPITKGGCDAPCLRDGIPCFGCRGPIENDEGVIKEDAAREKELLKEKGFDEEYVENRMREFASYYYEEMEEEG